MVVHQTKLNYYNIKDDIFRQLVKSLLSFPSSKAATVEYLKNHFDEDVNLSKIYRYLDKLSDHHHELVQKYQLDDFVVVADAGLMNNTNIEELEYLGYK